ncbi:MAG: Gfo/Idh/MocA family oxidoreductase [Saprospiraceae bacterium]|nr:Gfo/Idh/MocA family oxidoreductase [Saprospiraceae bacterium]
MKRKSSLSRRDMIRKGVTGAAGFMIVPRHVLGKGYTPPSDQLGIAAIGAGGKGRSDIINAWHEGKNKVVALCDIDTSQCKDTRKKFSDAKFYADFRKMLDELDGEIDAVTISTPDHTHAIAALTAMSMGKHVYVQKPLTHNIAEARSLTEAARKHKVVSQMGNQGASNPGQEQMVKWFDDDLIGPVRSVQVWTNRPVWPQGIPVPTGKVPLPDTISEANWDLFIGPAKMVDYHPLYHPFKWRGWWNFGTGALGDMGCHLIDPPFRVLQLGYPTEVECSVGQVFTQDWVPEYIPEGCPPSSRTEIKFPATANNPVEMKMTWHDGGLRPFHPDLIPANDFLGEEGSANGVLMIGEKGIMTCGTYGRNPQIYFNNGDKIGMAEDFESANPNAGENEYGHQLSWTEACKAGFGSDEHKALTSSFDYAGPLTETVLMGNLAIRSYMLGKKGNSSRGNLNFPGRKRLIWDGNAMKITNFEEANQFVSREYRKGWEI